MNAILDYLIDLIGRLGHWGYVAIFLIAALESAAFLGLLVPGESIVLVAGFLASRGALDLDALVITITAAAAFGDNVSYQLGHWLGGRWLSTHGGRFGVSAARIERTQQFFGRHGGKAVSSDDSSDLGARLINSSMREAESLKLRASATPVRGELEFIG